MIQLPSRKSKFDYTFDYIIKTHEKLTLTYGQKIKYIIY